MEEKKTTPKAKRSDPAVSRWEWTTENVNHVGSALAKVQAEIRTAIKKSANPFFKSSYADLAEVMDVAREPLARNHLAITQVAQPCGADGRTCLVTMLIHGPSGQCINSIYPITATKANDPQSIGSAITYARRYSLASIVGIVAEGEDDDGEAAQGRREYAKPSFKNETRTVADI